MNSSSGFRKYVAESFVKKEGVFDLDKAYVMADELFHDAANGDRKAKEKLGGIVAQYLKRELA